jgi:hypothetical protein
MGADVERLDLWAGGLVEEPNGSLVRYSDYATLAARVAELERGELKWIETCKDLRMMLDASQYVERHDAALKRAHAAEEQVAALTREVEGLRARIEHIVAPLRCGEGCTPDTYQERVDVALARYNAALAAADAARGTT